MIQQHYDLVVCHKLVEKYFTKFFFFNQFTSSKEVTTLRCKQLLRVKEKMKMDNNRIQEYSVCCCIQIFWRLLECPPLDIARLNIMTKTTLENRCLTEVFIEARELCRTGIGLV